MILVVDAAVAAKWFVPEPGRDQALRLLLDTDRLAAPDVLFADIFSIIWRKTARGEMTAGQARAVPAALEKFLAEIISARDLADEAGRLMTAGLLPPEHDPAAGFYLAAALLLDGRLITAEREWARRMRAGPLPDRIIDLYDVDSIDKILT